MRRVLNEDGGDEWRTWNGQPEVGKFRLWTTKFRGFSKANRDKKRGQFRVDQVLPIRYLDQESTDTRIGLMYQMARYKMILKRMVIFCHGDWCHSMKVHSYQTHNTFEIHFTTFLSFLPIFSHTEWCQIIGHKMSDICSPDDRQKNGKNHWRLEITAFSCWPMRWPSFRASILKGSLAVNQINSLEVLLYLTLKILQDPSL